jgi:sarcosine oxidase subunit beta
VADTSSVIIIGGGIHGSSLAFHLAEKGVQSIVLEKGVLAAGATGRSSGLVRMHYDLELESRLAWLSFQYFVNWKERVGGECGFTRTGFLQFVPSEQIDQLKANVEMHQQIGVPSMLIDQQDVKRLAPYFFVDDIELAAFEPESGYADPYATTTAFMDAARRMGAKLVQDCTVTGIQISGDRVTGVRTSRGDFSAEVVVNCAGAWADKIGAMAGVQIPIKTWRHDTMFVRRPKEIGPSHPTVIDNVYKMYFRPETGGLTLVGLEDNNPLGEDPDTNTDHAKDGFTPRATDRICQRVPIMEQGSLQGAHGGYDGLTPDQRAILGQAGPEGFYLQCGMSGTGFKIGPAVGACMAELIVDGEAQLLDISPFQLSRFEEGSLLIGDHNYGDFWH